MKRKESEMEKETRKEIENIIKSVSCIDLLDNQSASLEKTLMDEYPDYVVEQVKCSWDTFLVGYYGHEELPDFSGQERQSADLINDAKQAGFEIVWRNPQSSDDDFECFIIFPVSEILDFSDLDPEDQDSFLAERDNADEREECMSASFAKLTVVGDGSRNIVCLKDFVRCHPDNFWDFYHAISNTKVYLLKFWNSETCTLIMA